MTITEFLSSTPSLTGAERQLAEIVWHKAQEPLQAEIARLQMVIDSRPAINAGLPGSYIEWSQSIYAMEFCHAIHQGEMQ